MLSPVRPRRSKGGGVQTASVLAVMAVTVMGLGLVLALALASSAAALVSPPPEAQEFIAFVASRGYFTEYHEVETEDGYLLGVFRIPCARNRVIDPPGCGPPPPHTRAVGSSEPQRMRREMDGIKWPGNREPVIVWHGLLSSAFGWCVATKIPFARLRFSRPHLN